MFKVTRTVLDVRTSTLDTATFTGAFLTFTLNLADFLPDFTVILAVPAFLPFTTPLLVTVAIFFLLEDHFNLAFAGFTFTFDFNLTVLPTVTDTDFFVSFKLFALIVLASAGATQSIILAAKREAAIPSFFPAIFIFFFLS